MKVKRYLNLITSQALGLMPLLANAQEFTVLEHDQRLLKSRAV